MKKIKVGGPVFFLVIVVLGVSLAVSVSSNIKLKSRVSKLTDEKAGLIKEVGAKEKQIEEDRKMYTKLAARLHKVTKELEELKSKDDKSRGKRR